MNGIKLRTRVLVATNVRRPGRHIRSGTFLNPGIVTVPLACAAAVFLVPADPSAAGALFWPAWVLTAGILGAVAIDALNLGLNRIFRAEHLVMIAIVIVVYPELLQGFYSTNLEPRLVQTAFLAIGTFATMVAVGSSIKPGRLPAAILDLAKRQYPTKTVFRILMVCWLLAMFNFAYASSFSLSAMLQGLLADRWSAPWGRGQLGGWEAFRDFLTYFGYVVPTFTVVIALRLGSWSRSPVLVGLVCSCIILAFIAQSGSRRLIVVIIGSAMLTWLCTKRGQLKLGHYLIVACLILVTVVFLDIMLSQRRLGLEKFSYSRSDFKGLRVDDNFWSLAETLRAIPAEANFVGFHHLWYVMVRPIPRVFWEGKPVNSGFDLAQHLHAKGVGLANTFIGESYMSFGWLGIILGGGFVGWLARHWSQLLEKDYAVIGTALYGLGAMALFLGIRSMLELVLMRYPILCWYALDRFLWKWTHRRSRAHENIAFARTTR